MQSSSKPPIAEKKPHDTTIHGDTLTDDYFWLREKTNPEVVKYLNAENTYTDEVTRDLNPFCENLYNEFLSHIKQTDLSVPYRLGRFYYYSRTEEGLQYPVYCRKTISPGSVEEVLLDLNELSNGRPYLAVSVYTVSEDGNLLAYSIDTTGFRQYELFIKDLKTGRLLADRIGTVTSAVWAADNRTLFYVKEDDAKRPYRLYRRRLGTRKDVLIYEDNDELYRVDVHKTRDRKFILLESASSETSEWRFLDSTDPEGTFRMISERQPGHEYYVDHRENLFYIRTNIDAINFRIMEAPDTDPEKSNWKELIAHRSDVKIEDVDLFKNHAVLAERYQGLVQLKILDFATGEVKSVAFPEPVYSVFPSKNPEFEVDAYRFNYQSFLTPGSIYEYDMRTGERNLLNETEVPGGYDRSLYESKRLWATADDGVKVPISVVMKKGIRPDGKNPLLLHGYGSYGYPSS
ncbi:MAG: S9 family peptidase, partial [Bacteroidetes bacterium]|nr:S9 family peptidase [Bacteroidota bacterium]